MASRDVSPVYFDYLVARCKASGFAPRIFHQVQSIPSRVAFVSRGQDIAFVPTSMSKLAQESVVTRSLHPEVNAAIAWDSEHKTHWFEEMIDHARQGLLS